MDSAERKKEFRRPGSITVTALVVVITALLSACGGSSGSSSSGSSGSSGSLQDTSGNEDGNGADEDGAENGDDNGDGNGNGDGGENGDDNGGDPDSVGETVLVNTELMFSCEYPLIGVQPLRADISSEMPTAMVTGQPTGSFDIQVVATAMGDTWTGMDLVGGRYIEGTAIAESNLFGNNLDLDLQVPTTIPRQDVPEEPGDFEILAEGATPSLVFDETSEGEVVITVGNINMALTATNEHGEPVFFPNSDPDTGEFPVPCTLDEGQDDVLHSFQVLAGGGTIDPVADAIPGEIDFGNVQQGLNATETLSVSNVGGGVLGITGIQIGGEDADAFMQNNDCNSLSGGETCSVDVTFFAEGLGQRSAALTIESTDPEVPVLEVALVATSIEPDVVTKQVDPASVDFGVIMPGETSTAQVLVANTGTGVLDIDEVSIGGADAGSFLQQHDCVTLLESESCVINLEFIPQGEFVHNATLIIKSTGDPGNPRAEVPLTGEGMGGGHVEMDLVLEGSTFIRASRSTVALSGSLMADLDPASGMFTADLDLDPASGTFRIFKLPGLIRARASIEFEQVEETTGTLGSDGVLESESRMHIVLSDVRLSFLGMPLFSIGSGDQCRTSQPVTVRLEGTDFDPLEGGTASGNYELPSFHNCGGFEGTINRLMAGPRNTIDLSLEYNH